MFKKRIFIITILVFIFFISSSISYNTLYHFKKNNVKTIELWRGDISVKIKDEKDIGKITDTLNNQIFITTIFPRKEKQGLTGLKFMDADNQQIKWLTYDTDERRLFPLGGRISKKAKEVLDSILNKYNIP